MLSVHTKPNILVTIVEHPQSTHSKSCNIFREINYWQWQRIPLSYSVSMNPNLLLVISAPPTLLFSAFYLRICFHKPAFTLAFYTLQLLYWVQANTLRWLPASKAAVHVLNDPCGLINSISGENGAGEFQLVDGSALKAYWRHVTVNTKLE